MPPGNSPLQFPSLPLRAPGISAEQQALEETFLASVQGNILKGHGRDFQRLLFFRFGPSLERNRRFLRALTEDEPDGRPSWVHSAQDQRRQIDFRHEVLRREVQLAASPELFSTGQKANLTRKIEKVDRQLFGSVMLTRTGLLFLGEEPPTSDSFRAGMKKRMGTAFAADEMAAPPYDCPGPTEEAFHGVLLLACDAKSTLEQEVSRWAAWCRDFQVEVLEAVEEGTAWREPNDPYGTGYGPPREPFGFVDGISMPRFFADDRSTVPMRDASQPTAWAWIDLTLEDVFFDSGVHAGGSFATLLKIEQNVAAFRTYESEVAELLETAPELRLPSETASYLAPAILMGRTRLGYSLGEVMHRVRHCERESDLRADFPLGPYASGAGADYRPPQLPPWLNEFGFTERDGRPMPATVSRGCPFHAHVRKMNPRVDDPDGIGDRKSLIQAQPVRRGATYDPHDLLGARERGELPGWPESGVGLLFFAYMRDLARQFEQAHTHWAPDTHFPAKGGVDPVLARSGGALKFGPLTLPAMPRVVRRLGGIYLYVPAITWLRSRGQ